MLLRTALAGLVCLCSSGPSAMDQQLLLACCSALRGALSMLSEDIAAAHSFLHFSMHRPCSVHLNYCRQITDEALIGGLLASCSSLNLLSLSECQARLGQILTLALGALCCLVLLSLGSP